jgi:hypothetical protein
MVAKTISRTDLARRTREVIDSARRRGPVMVASYGEEQVAVLDAVDFHLLQAIAAYQGKGRRAAAAAGRVPHGLADAELNEQAQHTGGGLQIAWNIVLAAYLDEDISLGRAAELLHISRWELQDRMNRLDLPLLAGFDRVADAEADVMALRRNTR